MKLLSRILGSVRVLEVTLTAGGYTVRTWSCKPGGIPQQVDQVPESVARSIVAVTFAGHGVISKSSEATGVSARVRSDAETFVWNEREGVFSFVRREKLRPVLGELAGAGIYPQCLLVAEPPEDAARTVLGRLRWRMLVRPTAEGSALAQAVVRRMGLPILGLFLVLLTANTVVSPSVGIRRQALQSALAAREQADSETAETDARRRELLVAFAVRPEMLRTVVCDRIAAAVPERVTLTALEVEPPEKRSEIGKPLRRQVHVVVVYGEAESAAEISEFVGKLTAEEAFGEVRLVQMERNTHEGQLTFRIGIGL